MIGAGSLIGKNPCGGNNECVCSGSTSVAFSTGSSGREAHSGG